MTLKYLKLLSEKKYLEAILKEGGVKANSIAEPIIQKAKNIVGFF